MSTHFRQKAIAAVFSPPFGRDEDKCRSRQEWKENAKKREVKHFGVSFTSLSEGGEGFTCFFLVFLLLQSKKFLQCPLASAKKTISAAFYLPPGGRVANAESGKDGRRMQKREVKYFGVSFTSLREGGGPR